MWQLIPVSLPGESHGLRHLADHCPKGHKEADTIERLGSQHACNRMVEGQPLYMVQRNSCKGNGLDSLDLCHTERRKD